MAIRFHLADPTDLHLGARRPRDNPAWPEVGIFGHRNMRRINWLGVSRRRLLMVDGLDRHVEELDAVDGTPCYVRDCAANGVSSLIRRILVRR